MFRKERHKIKSHVFIRNIFVPWTSAKKLTCQDALVRQIPVDIYFVK